MGCLDIEEVGGTIPHELPSGCSGANVRLCHIAHNPLSDQFGMDINTPFTKLLLLCYPEKPSLLDSSIPYKGNLVGCGAHSDFGDKFTTTPGGVINLCYGCME